VPAPVDEHFPAWEVRPKAGGTAGGVDDDPATAPRAQRSGTRARSAGRTTPAETSTEPWLGEVEVHDAFSWETVGLEDGDRASAPGETVPVADPPADLLNIGPAREPSAAEAEPPFDAFAEDEIAAPATSRLWRGSLEELVDRAPILECDAEIWNAIDEPASPSTDDEPDAETLAARLASLGALGADPAAFVQRAPGEGATVFGLHIDDLLRLAAERKASDLHLSEGLPPMIRVDGHLVKLEFAPLVSAEIQRLIYDVLTNHQIQAFEQTHELDFSYGLADIGRFRFNVYRQRGAIGAAMRAIPTRIPTIEELRLPPILRDLTRKPSGLVLVTGATGAGKSTTLAAMIHVINQERDCHIMTIEDPIEYVHNHGRAMVNQRELGSDTSTFQAALRAVLREDPDVILVGEMRDLETISAAITLAETGHLVFATLHTRNAPQTIDRIVDVFPPHQQDQIKVQLANSLEAVLAQQLLPRLGGGRIASVELMIANSAVRNLIREGKTAQLYSCIETGAQMGMQTMDRALVDLYRMGIISQEIAAAASLDRDNFQRLLRTR
jgi:twitching motility protein PilT